MEEGNLQDSNVRVYQNSHTIGDLTPAPAYKMIAIFQRDRTPKSRTYQPAQPLSMESMEDKMAKAKKKKTAIPTMVTQSKVKEFAKTLDPEIRVGGEFMAELNEKLAATINNSMQRCYGNKRKTLKPSDL